MLATCRWRSAMLAKETDCGASEDTRDNAVILIWEKAFREKDRQDNRQRQGVRATPSVSHGWFSTRLSQRP